MRKCPQDPLYLICLVRTDHTLLVCFLKLAFLPSNGHVHMLTEPPVPFLKALSTNTDF